MQNVKLLFVLFIAAFLSTNLFAQIPNNSFENWSGGNPDSWFTDNIFTFTPVTQSSDAQSGSSAVKLAIIDAGNGIPYFPTMISGDTAQGFPITEKYESLSGYYKFSPTTNNTLFWVYIVLYQNQTGIGAGYFVTPLAASSYTQFNMPITYNPGSGTPDKAIIEFAVYDSSSTSSGSIGSYSVVDNVSFGPVTAVESEDNLIRAFALNQNYPNPFNPATDISYAIPKESNVSLKVYNILGMEVATLVNRREAAGSYKVNFNASNLPSGIYLAKLNSSGYSKTIKMILMK